MNVYLASTFYDFDWRLSYKNSFCNTTKPLLTGKVTFNTPILSKEHTIEVVPLDKRVISGCDVLIAYIERYSAGTIMEIQHAFNCNVVVHIITPNRIVENDLWIKAHSHAMFFNIQDAVQALSNLCQVLRKETV